MEQQSSLSKPKPKKNERERERERESFEQYNNRGLSWNQLYSLPMHLYTIMFKSNEMRTGQIVYKKDKYTVLQLWTFRFTM